MITLSQEIIGFINIFEKLTGAAVKDCFLEEGKIVFVINPGNMGLAIGKNGSNIKHASAVLKKTVNIIEFNPDPVLFIKSLLFPIKPKEVKLQDTTILIVPNDTKEKGRIYGRERTNLKRMQDIASKYFPITIKIE